MDAYQISLIISVVLAIAEVMTLSFILLGFSIGMLAVSGVQYVFDGYNLNRDVMVFAVVSVVSFVALRKVFKKIQTSSALLKTMSTNIESHRFGSSCVDAFLTKVQLLHCPTIL